jgi:hypothetical protein
MFLQLRVWKCLQFLSFEFNSIFEELGVGDTK